MSSTFRPTAPAKHTIVEEGSSFKGTLTSTCPIHVHGRIEGDLETPSLMVSATGAVHGKAKVGSVRSQGELSGEFDADSVELAGTVRDNTVIRARSLEVKLASTRGKLQVIFGECELSVGDEPTEHDAVEPMATQVQAVVAEPVVLAPAGEGSVEIAAVAPASPQPASEAPVMPMAPAEAATAETAAEGDDEDDADEATEAEALEAHADGESGKKRRKRRRNSDVEMPKTGWSQPPSQPPPAN